MFAVAADPVSAVVHIHLSGFFDHAEVACFWREEQEVARAAQARHGTYDLLIETAGGMAQGQDVLAAFHRVIVESPVKARRIVIVSESALLRLQIRRVLASDTLQVVETLAEAEAWLASPERNACQDKVSLPS
ncbi:hypothetical protein [Sphingomonas sp. PB4P5]|uniref:hypothetical protein n=1 Tax=Parasphingomonas puruogangriensis TaxID=3096155 RepID=UPI002FCA4AE1